MSEDARGSQLMNWILYWFHAFMVRVEHVRRRLDGFHNPQPPAPPGMVVVRGDGEEPLPPNSLYYDATFKVWKSADRHPHMGWHYYYACDPAAVRKPPSPPWAGLFLLSYAVGCLLWLSAMHVGDAYMDVAIWERWNTFWMVGDWSWNMSHGGLLESAIHDALVKTGILDNLWPVNVLLCGLAVFCTSRATRVLGAEWTTMLLVLNPGLYRCALLVSRGSLGVAVFAAACWALASKRVLTWAWLVALLVTCRPQHWFGLAAASIVVVAVAVAPKGRRIRFVFPCLACFLVPTWNLAVSGQFTASTISGYNWLRATPHHIPWTDLDTLAEINREGTTLGIQWRLSHQDEAFQIALAQYAAFTAPYSLPAFVDDTRMLASGKALSAWRTAWNSVVHVQTPCGPRSDALLRYIQTLGRIPTAQRITLLGIVLPAFCLWTLRYRLNPLTLWIIVWLVWFAATASVIDGSESARMRMELAGGITCLMACVQNQPFRRRKI